MTTLLPAQVPATVPEDEAMVDGSNGVDCEVSDASRSQDETEISPPTDNGPKPQPALDDDDEDLDEALREVERAMNEAEEPSCSDEDFQRKGPKKRRSAPKPIEGDERCQGVLKTGGQCTKRRTGASEFCASHKKAATPKASVAAKGKGKGKQPAAAAAGPAVPAGPAVATDPKALAKLAKEFPDQYWNDWRAGSIQTINAASPIRKATELTHAGAVQCVSWSPAGDMMCTTSSFGSVRVWDATGDWRLLQELRDSEEKQIEEFYVARFSPDCKRIFAAGKLKDRDEWDENDDDNCCVPGKIKVFDLMSGNVLSRLSGHTEEILQLKVLMFKNRPHLATASQDGTVRKWFMADDWVTCHKQTPMNDEQLNMAFDFAFLPETANKYLCAAADDGLTIYDFEAAQPLQRFEDLYTSFCDCVRFITPSEPVSMTSQDGAAGTDKGTALLLVTRGVESLDARDEVVRPNTVHIRKLVMPSAKGGDFQLETLSTLHHPDYKANVWPSKIASNGRYVLAPTSDGRTFCWNLRTTALAAILQEHGDHIVRDVSFHKSRPLLVTCADDGSIAVFSQGETESKQEFSDSAADPMDLAE